MNSASQNRGWHSRGYLPHFDGGETAQFITFRLFDSIPQKLLDKWRLEIERESDGDVDIALRRRIEFYLDQNCGSCYLRHPQIAGLVQDAMLFLDGNRYHLIAWVVMPNHVHLLATPLPQNSLSKIMQSLKGYTGREANKHLNRKGFFWQADYFDRYIRDNKHFLNTIAYIENNPVKAKLCEKPEDWVYSSANFKTGTRTF